MHAAPPVLLVPGLRDSGPAHWQSHWQRELPGASRFHHDAFHAPDLARWSAALAIALDAFAVPPLVVAHSFGCLASVHAATAGARPVAGALLVAPADPARFGIAGELHGAALPFPSMLVASSDDPWLRLVTAGRLATAWGAQLVVYGRAGHINADAGFGPWPEGRALLSALARRAAPGDAPCRASSIVDRARAPGPARAPRRAGASAAPRTTLGARLVTPSPYASQPLEVGSAAYDFTLARAFDAGPPALEFRAPRAAGASSATRSAFALPAAPRRRVLPGFGLALGYTLAWLSLIVLIPLSAAFLKAATMSGPAFLAAVTAPRVLASYRLTFGASFAAALVNAVFGFLVAWVLVRYRFPGRRLADAIVDLPFALPTAVAGIALTGLFAANGWIGSLLAPLGIKVAYTPLGVFVALTFIGLPFVVRTVQPVLESLPGELEEAAATLGAGRAQVFARVILPAVLPALITGFALAFARAIGEYGSVVFIAGNMPMVSEITPLIIIAKLEQYDYQGATAVATVMLVISFALLLAINLLQAWTRRRQGALT